MVGLLLRVLLVWRVHHLEQGVLERQIVLVVLPLPMPAVVAGVQLLDQRDQAAQVVAGPGREAELELLEQQIPEAGVAAEQTHLQAQEEQVDQAS